MNNDLDNCIDYNALSIFIVSVLGSAGAFCTLMMASIRKSRCTDMNFCCGCISIHRELMSIEEMKYDNRLEQASPSEQLVNIPSQQFMKQPPHTSSNQLGINHINNSSVALNYVKRKSKTRIREAIENLTPPSSPTNKIRKSTSNKENFIIKLTK